MIIKAMGAVIAALLIAIGLLTFQAYYKDKKIEGYQLEIGQKDQALAQLTQDMHEAEKSIDGLLAEIEQRNIIAIEHQHDIAVIGSEKDSLEKQVKILREKKPHVKNYLDTAMPDSVYSLFKSAGNSDKNKDGGSLPARAVHD